MARIGGSFLYGQGVAGSSRDGEESTPRLPLHHRPVPTPVRHRTTTTAVDDRYTYVVARLLIFVALLVRLGLGLVRLALLGA